MNMQDISRVQIYHSEHGGYCDRVDRSLIPCGREANYMRTLKHKDGFTVTSELCLTHAREDSDKIYQAIADGSFDGTTDISGL